MKLPTRMDQATADTKNDPEGSRRPSADLEGLLYGETTLAHRNKNKRPSQKAVASL